MTTTLRSITASARELHDLEPALAELTNDALRGDRRDDGAPAHSSTARWLLRGDRHDAWLVLAEDDLGRLVGWSLIRAPGRAVGRLDVYVWPRRRREGLGSWLVAESARLALALGIDRLQARPWNAASEAFYAAAGFVTVLDRGVVGVSGLAERATR